MRFYLIVRVLRSESQRFAPSARLRGNMCRVPFSTWYVIKAWMLEYPWQVLGAVQLYFLLATAYTVGGNLSKLELFTFHPLFAANEKNEDSLRKNQKQGL